MLSSKFHTIAGIAVGIALILAPMLFGFADHQIARLTAQIVGLFMIFSELITTSVISPLKVISMRTYIVIVCLAGALLAGSPWLLGFEGAGINVWLPHVVMGVLIIGYTSLTNPARDSIDRYAIV